MTTADDTGIRLALDTSILTSAEGLHGDEKRSAARHLIARLPTEATVLPIHTLGELCHVLVHEAGRTPADARAAMLSWYSAFPVVGTSPEVMLVAADLITETPVNIWDAVILAAAWHARCRLLLSENFGEAFTWGSVTITNPFVDPIHPLLDRVLLPPGD